VLHLQDTLSLNKYALPTYRTEDSYVKSIHFDSLHQQHCKHHHQHQHQHPHHRQETSRQEQQQQRHSLLFDKTDFTTSKSHVLNADSQLLNESINYKNELNELITEKLNVSSISSNSTITITTTITTNTSNTSLNTISTTYLSTSYNDKHTIKCIPKLVPPLIGINETNLNDTQNLQNDIFLNTITSTTYNTTHDEIDNNDNINQYKNQYETNDLLINTNCCHDTLQSNYWLPKVAMNSNRTKYDEILSTSWHLLTMKNWKSDQELKRKMGLLNKTTSNFGSGSSSSNGIGGLGIGKAGIGGGGGGVSGSGGFWFREKTTNIKPFFTGRRRIDNHQSQQSIHQYKQQSKGIKITALDMYSKKLTSFEREEILNFSKIWYLGLSAQKIDGIQGSSNNHGYDDDNGGYLKITHDHIAYRFQTLETLGKGSFGRVIRAIDHKSGFPVAIKIIRNKKRFHQQAQVEVAILENLKKADHKNTHNIIHIRDHFTFRNHLCIVFDLLGSNLYDLLRKNDFRGFTIHSLKKITVKLLNCLCLLRKQGIIHCDLKPENILIGLNNSSELKVIDFGSSCFTNQKTYTYIQSRFYRAPEIILGISYGPPIDMWSLGCILPELYTGRPLFPGENENEQLACIMEVLGVPSELLLEKASRRRVFFDSKRTPRYLTNSRGRKRIPGSETIENLVKTVDSKWDPDERLTPNEALNHEWILHENEHNKQNITFQTLEHTNSENKQKDTIA
ncbi:Dual specificity tyrosine-phosphorylation-regulated kinase 4, partial [Schistosoma japonicum]